MAKYNHRETVERETGYYRSRNRVVRWEDVHNPIPDTLSEQEYSGLFTGEGKPFFVPYAGWQMNSVHSYLDLLILLAKLSVTHGSCISSQDFVCFGGAIDIVGDHKKYAFQEDIELSEAEKLAYVETVSQYLPEFDAKTIMSQAFQWGKMTGDRWYLVEGDDNIARVEVLDPRSVLYYVDPDIDYKVVGITEGRFTAEKEQNEQYILVPEYPQIGEYNGGFRTVVHFKDGHNMWYGRPDTEQAIITMFREYKDDEYFLKASANHFTGRAILELEDDPIPEDDSKDSEAREGGHKDFAAQIDANLTNKAADPMAFLMMTRPYQSGASVLHQVGTNTPEGFFDFLNQTSLQKIVMAHKWSQKLLGIEQASGLSTNQFHDIFKIKRVGVIKKYQDMLSAELKEVLDVVGGIYGFENNARFVGTTPFDELSEEMKAQSNIISGEEEEMEPAKPTEPEPRPNKKP